MTCSKDDDVQRNYFSCFEPDLFFHNLLDAVCKGDWGTRLQENP